MADYRIDLDGFLARDGSAVTTDEIMTGLRERDELKERLESALTCCRERADKIREQDERIRQLDALVGEMTGAFEIEKERLEAAEEDRDYWNQVSIRECKQAEALAAHLEEIKRVRSIPRDEVGHDGRRVQLLIEAIDKPSVTSARPSSEVQQLRARVAYLEARLAQASEEGCALAAHTKELRRHIFSNIKHKEGCPGSWDEDCTCGKSTILRQDTETSLDRLIAQKQAEVLGAEADRLNSFAEAAMSPEQEAYEHAADELRETANELRRHAQGANNEDAQA